MSSAITQSTHGMICVDSLAESIVTQGYVCTVEPDIFAIKLFAALEKIDELFAGLVEEAALSGLIADPSLIASMDEEAPLSALIGSPGSQLILSGFLEDAGSLLTASIEERGSLSGGLIKIGAILATMVKLTTEDLIASMADEAPSPLLATFEEDAELLATFEEDC